MSLREKKCVSEAFAHKNKTSRFDNTQTAKVQTGQFFLLLQWKGQCPWNHEGCFRARYYQQWCNLNKAFLLEHSNMSSIGPLHASNLLNKKKVRVLVNCNLLMPFFKRNKRQQQQQKAITLKQCSDLNNHTLKILLIWKSH